MAGAHNVPEEVAAVPNPISATDESVTSGAAIFATNCAVCHGEKGVGDGPAAESLENKPADLTAGHVQELSDGALFYIVTHGKPETPMPAWEGVLEEEDRWNAVNFMRSLVDAHEDGDHTEDEHAEDEHSD
jgi:mono/diheme cytochrome c family protein